MFLKNKVTTHYFTPETIHRKMECWIIIFNRIYEITNRNLCIKLFFDLTLKRLLRCFTWFDLSTRELPAIFEFAITSLSSKDDRLTFFIYCFNYCCNYSYCFQFYASFSIEILLCK